MHGKCNMIDDRYSCDVRLDAATIRRCFDISTEYAPLRILVGDYCVDMMELSARLCIDQALRQQSEAFATIHSSEAAFNQLPRKDFPRFRKPVEFAKLLNIKGDDGNTAASDSVAYDGSWKKPTADCGECGYTVEVAPYCKVCKRQRRTCHAPLYSLFCEHCHPGMD